MQARASGSVEYVTDGPVKYINHFPGRVAVGQVLGDKRPRAGLVLSLAGAALASAAANTFPWTLVFCCVWQPQRGCLNFSQRQIFIHQSTQRSAGRAASARLRRRAGAVPLRCAQAGPSWGWRRLLGFGDPCERWLCPRLAEGDTVTGAVRALQFLLESLQLIFPLERCQAFDSA